MAKHLTAHDDFQKLVDKAYDLGVRMEQAGFSRSDNPYHGCNPKLARVWSEGFSTPRLAGAWLRLTNKEDPDSL